MNEEKSMTEYKEQKGIFQWLKSKFEKLKEKFRPTKNVQEIKNESQDGQELFEEDLDKVKGGIPLKTVDKEELMADLGIEPKSWELTEEQLDEIKAGYPNVNPEQYQQKQDEQELSEEELDKITAGHPIIDDDEHSK